MRDYTFHAEMVKVERAKRASRQYTIWDAICLSSDTSVRESACQNCYGSSHERSAASLNWPKASRFCYT